MGGFELKLLITCLAIWGALLAPSVHADAYPEKPIKLVVPFPAGGTVDVLARKTAHALEAGLKQTIVIDNKTGANGAIAVETVMRAPPDGYTMLFNSVSMTINQVIYPNVKYDVLRDFIPVSEAMAQESYLLLVASDSPFQNLSALIESARQHPGSLNYASPGIGNAQHLLMEMLAYKSGTKLTHIPFKGIPDMTTALLRHDVTVMLLNPLLADAHMKSGKVRAIAQVRGSTSRSAAYPDIPAISETVSGFSWTPGRFGFFFPTGTPTNIVSRMQNEIAKSVQTAELRDYLKKGGFTPVGSTSSEYSQAIQLDLQRFTEISRIANISVN